MINITTATTTTLDVTYGVRIEFNKASVGIVTISDGSTLRATIAIGRAAAWVAYGFTNKPTIVTAAAEDLTVSSLNHQ